MRSIVRIGLIVLLATSGCSGSSVTGETGTTDTAPVFSSSTIRESTTTTAGTTTSTNTPTTTVLVTTTTTTLPPIEHVESGLFCRDLHAAGYSYAEAVAYWVREGSPDRMDAARNGIPCETVWPATNVMDFWGDPLPTTTILPQRYEVDDPTYHPESLPGAGDYFGSGCSPGTTKLPDGVWFGHIESVASSAIEFDLICFAPTPPGEDGVGRFTNSSPKLRTVPVESTATVHAIAPDGFWELQEYATWHLDPGQEGFCEPDGCWNVWLYVNSGYITEIVQIWFA